MRNSEERVNLQLNDSLSQMYQDAEICVSERFSPEGLRRNAIEILSENALTRRKGDRAQRKTSLCLSISLFLAVHNTFSLSIYLSLFLPLCICMDIYIYIDIYMYMIYTSAGPVRCHQAAEKVCK